MAKADWFKTGTEGVTVGKKLDAEADRKRQESRDENFIAKKRRLWMPQDSSVLFTLIDTVGLGV